MQPVQIYQAIKGKYEEKQWRKVASSQSTINLTLETHKVRCVISCTVERGPTKATSTNVSVN